MCHFTFSFTSYRYIVPSFRLFVKQLVIEEVVKASGSSDDNKKEFFKIASHILKNSGLFQGADA
ncbi:hypothetical protein FQT08_01850 [Enterococcus hirae]|nr:hypothetical protein [Enterococcus hirae]TGY25019.1 hypothetical protein E5348_07330 [Enterococcus hirae]